MFLPKPSNVNKGVLKYDYRNVFLSERTPIIRAAWPLSLSPLSPPLSLSLPTSPRRVGFSFDPESETGQRAVKLVIEQMAERSAADMSKTKVPHRVSKGVPGRQSDSRDGGNADGSGDGCPASSAIHYAKKIPILALKLESRACGLLAAWVQATVVLFDALCTAAKT